MTITSEIRSGIALGLSLFFWLLLEFFLGFHSKYIDYLPFITWLFVVIPAVGINWALKAKRDRYYLGQIGIFQALKTGLIITLVMAIVSALMQFLYVIIVNPMFYDTMTAHARGFITGLDIAAEDKETMLAKSLKENTITYGMLKTFFTMLIIGTLMSVFASVLIKRNVRADEIMREKVQGQSNEVGDVNNL
jgi:hypothetical protein